MTPRERLDLAIAHFEAAHDDPGRLGLAFVEVIHARNDLLEEERPLFRISADVDDDVLTAAIERTVRRLAVAS